MRTRASDQIRSQAISNTAETRFLLIFAMAYHVHWTTRPQQQISNSLGRPATSVYAFLSLRMSRRLYSVEAMALMGVGVNVMESDDVRWRYLTRPDDPSQGSSRGCHLAHRGDDCPCASCPLLVLSYLYHLVHLHTVHILPCPSTYSTLLYCLHNKH
jgi:hypothetical protein